MTKRKLYQALYKDSAIVLWFTIRYMIFDWPKQPLKIFLKILSLLLTPVLLCLALFQTLTAILGIFFNCVPVLREIMAFIFIMGFGNFIIMPVLFFSTAYNYKDYQRKLRYYNFIRRTITLYADNRGYYEEI